MARTNGLMCRKPPSDRERSSFACFVDIPLNEVPPLDKLKEKLLIGPDEDQENYEVVEGW